MATFPIGKSAVLVEMEGMMQHAPQFGRQSISFYALTLQSHLLFLECHLKEHHDLML